MVTGHDDLSTLPGVPSPTRWSGSTARSSCIRRSGSARATTTCSRHDGRLQRGCKARFRVDHVSTSECPLKPSKHPGEFEKCQLTEPRNFNLMFKTIVGALAGEEDAAFLRPETAQGMFVNFKNVCDSSRVKIPFGIAQVGKASATRSRRGISPSARASSSRWRWSSSASRASRRNGTSTGATALPLVLDLGLAGDMRLREHERRAGHYSCGTADIDTLSLPAAGRIRRVGGDCPPRRLRPAQPHGRQARAAGRRARRGERTRRQAAPSGSGKDLTTSTTRPSERYIPHVIEPSAGADRATLAFLCEAYTEDSSRTKRARCKQRLVLRVASRACADQGGRLSAGEEGRHAGNGARKFIAT